MELVKMKKPLASLDFCYSGECENISVQVFPPKFIPRFSRQYLNILPAYSYFIFFTSYISTLQTFLKTSVKSTIIQLSSTAMP
jgi:hypothetical protein